MHREITHAQPEAQVVGSHWTTDTTHPKRGTSMYPNQHDTPNTHNCRNNLKTKNSARIHC